MVRASGCQCQSPGVIKAPDPGSGSAEAETSYNVLRRYDNYMKYAFPLDELNPLECSGRGPDHDNPDNININDVLGDYSLTLIDTLDTLALLGNSSGT